ncbi:MAG TPA: type II secretion system protein GspJ [Verrucomicrobiae bacterium]|nr:type II secretion system protein GspJ [Verrucomicrobiae bacterium]
MRARKMAGAFTLLEIMVAMFLFSLVVAAVYSSWTAIVRGSQTGLKAAAEVQRSRVAIRTIEQALTSARAFSADIDYYTFDSENGDEAYLSFVAKLPDSFPRSGRFEPYDVRRVTFAVERGDTGNDLVLRQTPLLMDMDIDEKEHPIVLAKNIKKFELAFWDAKKEDWMDEWADTNQLPAMVKVSLEFGGKDAQSKPREEVTRVVALPAIMVPPAWQVPGARPGAAPPGVIRPPQHQAR